jgi:hypothetical protein
MVGIIHIMDWRSQIQAEFNKAEQARDQGNEGKARVCARRAAGLAAREYFARRGQLVRTPSAYDVLNLLIEDRSLADDLRQAAQYLTMRVNEEFKLPVDVDLLAVARKLCEGLLVDNK